MPCAGQHSHRTTALHHRAMRTYWHFVMDALYIAATYNRENTDDHRVVHTTANHPARYAAMLLHTHQWVYPCLSTSQLRVHHAICAPRFVCCATPTTSQGLQQWVKTQVSTVDDIPLNRPHTSVTAELYDLDMQLLANILQAARQPGKPTNRGHKPRGQQHVNTTALEAVLDAATPDAEQLSR